MMWPSDPALEGSPSETMLPSRPARVLVMSTPTVTAIATAAMNDTETFTGLEVVTKMIADIICGPAIIAIARGRISRFMISCLYVRGLLLHLSSTTY
jgi:hypothetical protein